jgi:hypothetical protein
MYIDMRNLNQPYKVTLYKRYPYKKDFQNFTYPCLGFGKTVISRLEDTYAHNPRVINTMNEVDIVYQSSMVTRSEGNVLLYDITLVRIDKVTGEKIYKRIMSDLWQVAYYDNQLVKKSYNHAIGLKNNVININFAAKVADEYTARLYRTFNLNTGELSDIGMCQLMYGSLSEPVDFTLNNYIKMVNTYGYSLDESVVLSNSLDTCGIKEYNGTYYTILTYRDYGVENPPVNPLMLMSSTDLVTWSPIGIVGGFLTDPVYSGRGEVELAIANDKILWVQRIEHVYYGVCGIDGTVIKSQTLIDNTIADKPAAFTYADRLFAIYSTRPLDVATNAARTKIILAELNSNNELVTINTIHDQEGFNYYDVGVFGSNILMANTARIRGEQLEWNPGPTGGLTLQSLQVE